MRLGEGREEWRLMTLDCVAHDIQSNYDILRSNAAKMITEMDMDLVELIHNS